MSKFSLPAYFGVIVLALVLFQTVSAQADDNYESPSPALVTENGTARIVAIDPELFRGVLPQTSQFSLKPNSSVMIFLTGLRVAPDEGANAFRVLAEAEDGRVFRLMPESITELRRQRGIYALTFRVRDETGFLGQPEGDSYVLRVTWRGNTTPKAIIGDGKFPGEKLRMPDDFVGFSRGGSDRGRFMHQAAFGPTPALETRLGQIGYKRWLNEQIALPYPTIPYPNFPLRPFDGAGSCGTYGVSQDINFCHRNTYWNYQNQRWMFREAFYGEDQLRRRVSWALHQIWVVSHNNISQQRATQEYIEILDRNAFGNYRTLMREMTLSPAMGEFLDMVRSTRQNPNENYPRELLQLFTIGLYMLNPDGTLQLDAQGNPIPTYDQAKIDQFTKVFTGWTHCNNGNDPRCPGAVLGIANYIDPMILQFPGNHDTTAKTLFNYPGAPNPTIAACTNCTNDTARAAYANDSLEKTLDNIFYHPNVGPFISKILIQHLVTSDPSPAYVQRVATVFNNNGAGVRGDMAAVVKTILLDREARGSRKTDPSYGKLRDPFHHLASVLRMFGVRASPNGVNAGSSPPPASCNGQSDGVIHWMTDEMGQDIWAPPSVFSYFPPEYIVPGTTVPGPEFAMANTGSSFARNNHMFAFTFWSGIWWSPSTAQDMYPWVPCGTAINLADVTAWAAADPSGNTLIEGLNQRMMNGNMSEAMKAQIRTAITANVQPQLKAQQAAYLIGSSSQYQIQR